jgi:hypothetical protein
MIRILCFLLGALLALVLTVTAQPERVYGEVVPYDAQTPLPIPPLSFFAIGIETNADLLARVVQYCTADTERMAVWFEETHPERLKALCGMYIVATNSPYHEQPSIPENALAFALQQTQHCGTIPVAQGEIYDALGLTWRYRQTPHHGWIDAAIDDQWETFDATVNVWYADQDHRRMFWIPDYAGAFDHERYCHDWGCFNMRNLRRDVFERGAPG